MSTTPVINPDDVAAVLSRVDVEEMRILFHREFLPAAKDNNDYTKLREGFFRTHGWTYSSWLKEYYGFVHNDIGPLDKIIE